MPRFSEQYLDRVRAANPIQEVVGERITLQKNGKNFKACCPFHHEKTPSFYVTPDRGIFKCFGCGKGGGVFQFLMEYEGLTFSEAVTKLAERANIPPEDGNGLDDAALARISARQTRQKRLAKINSEALDFFQRQLSLAGGEAARKYLADRGVSAEAVRAYRLGYSPEGWDALCRHLGAQGYREEEMVAAGVALENQEGGGCHDRFRHRVIFPIWDHAGQVVAFGGRSITGEEPKYLNTSETEVYRKSQVLYALNFAKDPIKEMRKTAILCEGYLDVVMLGQHRFVNAVASCGTSLTSEQARLLKRFADTCILTYDGDSAGQKAALRAIPLLNEAGLSVYVAPLSENEDPDSFLRKYGREAFQKVLDSAESYFQFAMKSLARERNLNSIQERYALCKEMFPLLVNPGSDGLRQELMGQLSEFAGVPLPSLNLDFANFLRSAPKRREREEQPKEVFAGEPETGSRPSPAETLLLAIVFSDDAALDYAWENLEPDFLENELVRRLFSRAGSARSEGAWRGSQKLLDECDEDERETLAAILTEADLPERKSSPDQDQPCWLRALNDCIRGVCSAHYEHEIKRLNECLRNADDPGVTSGILKKISIYSQKRREVSRIRTFKSMARENEKK